MGSVKKSGSKQIQPGESQRRIRIGVYTVCIIVACLAAGGDFVKQRRPERIYPSPALTEVKHLSDYLPTLKNSRGDTELYIFDSRHEGGTVLVLGGTHPNEPAANVSAVVMLENIYVDQGKVIIIARANNSGFTATEPQEAFPHRFFIKARKGHRREFRVGSRFTNLLDGWPDPVVYQHHPSGQLLSGNETRNLNRAYPGRQDGTLTERVAFAITEIVRREKVDLVIDLHEAAPEYPVINAIVAHERAMDVASMTMIDLQMTGLDFNLEASPQNFHGLIHREIGDATEARVMLFESAGALQGRLRGVTDTLLITQSVDPLYYKAGQHGKLAVDFPESGIPLEVRVGRHLEAVNISIRTLGDFEPQKSINISRVPGYAEIQSHGVGFYLK